jgi:hypothetical protein
MKITLPDFVTDVSMSDDNCELKVFKWCTDPQTIDIFAALGLTKKDDGGFDVRLKDQICTFSPATLAVSPDNPNEFIFNNQFGQTTVITVPSVALDMDGATLNGSVLQLTFGGDGNPGSLNVDICAVVANNCNATLTVNDDGSLTHVSNAGVITNVPAPVNITKSGTAIGLNNAIVDEASNPIMDRVSDKNGATTTQCDGTEICESPDFISQRLGWGGLSVYPEGVPIDPASTFGDGGERCAVLPIAKCGQRVRVDTYHSATIRTDTDGGVNIDMSVLPMVSTDGGATYTGIATGGSDRYTDIGLATGSSRVYGEVGFSDMYYSPVLPCGDATICVKFGFVPVASPPQVNAGRLDVNAQEAVLTTLRTKFC